VSKPSTLSPQELTRRKQQIRDLWNYKPLDHIPIWLTAYSNPWNYSVYEISKSTEKQLAVQMASIDRTLDSVPDDVIPVLQPSVASGNELPVAMGASLFWGENPEQGPSIHKPIISSTKEAYELRIPEWREHPIICSWLDRVAFFAQETEWPLALNLIGPTDTILSISEGVWFYRTMLEEPNAIEHLYSLAAETMIQLSDQAIDITQDAHRVTELGARVWSPEGCTGYVSDDVATAISPKLFEQLNQPTNEKLFSRYGPGIMHICGPHPSAHLYTKGKSPPRAITVSWRYTYKDLPLLGQSLAGKAVVYVELTDYQIWRDPDYSPLVARYQHMVDLFSPTTLGVAYLQVSEDVNLRALYKELRTISERYAMQMDWP